MKFRINKEHVLMGEINIIYYKENTRKSDSHTVTGIKVFKNIINDFIAFSLPIGHYSTTWHPISHSKNLSNFKYEVQN